MDYNKGIYKNITELYEKVKEIRKKRERTKEVLKEFGKKQKTRKEEKIEDRREKKWYHKFYWSYTYKGNLIIGGKNKEQNEEIFSKYFEKEDLFFHADIIGGSVVILKKGKSGDEQEKIETAQFSVCFCKAWKENYKRLSSYCVDKEGVSKSDRGKKAEKGSFFIIGERKWYKNLPLSLRMGLRGEDLVVVPSFSKISLEKELLIKPGKMKKEAVVKEISKYYKRSKEEVGSLLPSGRFYYSKSKNY